VVTKKRVAREEKFPAFAAKHLVPSEKGYVEKHLRLG